jgi:hypothetical protein
MKDNGLRYANIGLVVGTSIFIAGTLAFRGSSEAGMQATALVGFFAGFAIYHYLDERAKKRRRRALSKNHPQ